MEMHTAMEEEGLDQDPYDFLAVAKVEVIEVERYIVTSLNVWISLSTSSTSSESMKYTNITIFFTVALRLGK